MKKNIKFYKCQECENIIEVIDGNISNITCCEKKMEEIKANTIDAATEKHVPVYEKIDNKIIVRVGEKIHPMDEDHYIMWIMIVSDNKVMKTNLKPHDKPEVEFVYQKGAILYSYCNKHGLWKNDIK